MTEDYIGKNFLDGSLARHTAVPPPSMFNGFSIAVIAENEERKECGQYEDELSITH